MNPVNQLKLLQIEEECIPESVRGNRSHWWWVEAATRDITTSENESWSSSSDTGYKKSLLSFGKDNVKT